MILRAVSVGCAQSKKMHMLGVGAAPPLWMLFESQPPRLLPSELVTLVTVTGEDVTLAPPPHPRPLHHLILCESAFYTGRWFSSLVGFQNLRQAWFW